MVRSSDSYFVFCSTFYKDSNMFLMIKPLYNYIDIGISMETFRGFAQKWLSEIAAMLTLQNMHNVQGTQWI